MVRVARVRSALETKEFAGEDSESQGQEKRDGTLCVNAKIQEGRRIIGN